MESNKIKCEHCDNMIAVNDAEYAMDIDGNYICYDCKQGAVVIKQATLKTGQIYYNVDGIVTGDASRCREEFTTGFYNLSETARQRAIKMAKKLYGDNVVIIEE